jgi:hypothetical protein
MTSMIEVGALIPYTPPIGAPEVLLVDLDGTLCLRGGRSPYDETRVFQDIVNEPVRRIIYAVVASTGCRIIFTSGRSEKCREGTEAWLAEHFALKYEALLMRPAGDGRRDWQVKYEMFNDRIRAYYTVVGAFDDRNQVVRMWRSIGLTVFQVADGAF